MGTVLWWAVEVIARFVGVKQICRGGQLPYSGGPSRNGQVFTESSSYHV